VNFLAVYLCLCLYPGRCLCLCFSPHSFLFITPYSLLRTLLQFTDAQAQDAFNLHAGGDGKLTEDKLPVAIRTLGLCVTDVDIKDAAASTAKPLSLADFQTVAGSLASAQKTLEDLKQAINILDLDPDDNGKINLDKLRAAVTGSGDTLTDAQVDEVLQQHSGDERISAAEFFKLIGAQ
jgi:Ca2+-binding EF-hand superfamily protein